MAALPLKTARDVERESRRLLTFSDLPTSVQNAERMANSIFYARPSTSGFEVKSKEFAKPFNGIVISRYRSREDGCAQWFRGILTITQFPEI